MTTFTRAYPVHRGMSILAIISIAVLSAPGCSSESTKPRTSENSRFSNPDSGTLAGEGTDPAANQRQLLSEPLEIPSGDAATLIKFIKEVTSVQPSTREEAMIMAQAVLEASNRIIKDKQATEMQRRLASGKKLNSLQGLWNMNAPGVKQQVVDFAKELSVDKDPQLVQQGRTILFGFRVQSVVGRENKDYEQFKAETLKFLSDGNDSSDVFNLVHQAALALQGVEREEEAAEIFQALGATFKDNSDEDLAREALNILQLAEVFRADLDIKFEELSLKGVSAYPPLKESIAALLAMENPGSVVFFRIRTMADMLERSNFTEQAIETYQVLESTYQDSQDEDILATVELLVTRSIVRLSLVGKPVEVEGILTTDGSRINWASYKDKVVLLNFWATWDVSSLRSLPELLEQYNQYHEKGFEVIGVNIDENPQMFDAFTKEGIKEVLQIDAFPWVTITTTDPDQRGFDTPLAVTCGISNIPSTVLIGRDGQVMATNVGGDSLKRILITVLGETDSEPEETPASTPEEKENSGLGNNTLFSSLAMFKAIAAPFPWSTRLLLTDEGDEEPDKGNPYLAPAGLSVLDLVDYLLDMQEKPRSIRRRPGFAEAVSEAADRVLEAKTSDRYHVIAVEAKVQVLHEMASLGNESSDALLVALVEKLKDDGRPQIASLVRFLRMEQAMLDVDELPLAEVPAALDAIQKYLSGEKLQERHLRIASATVHGINRLEDAEQKENYFQVFGKIFGGSTDKTLASYGRKIASSPSAGPADLVGKSLELEGETELGVALDWKSYRGKVVLIDFWATWCGPCLREMPHVRALHKRLEKQGFTVLAINLDRNQEDLDRFLKENDLPWTNLVAEGARKAATRYGVRAIPTMIVVDQQGKVAAVSHRVADLTGTIEKLVKKPAGK